MKYLKNFNQFNSINESADSSILSQLAEKAMESTKMKNYFEANDFLKGWIQENQEALSKESGEGIVKALESWYDEWHKDWENAEKTDSIELEDEDDFENQEGEEEQSSEEELGELF